MERWAGILVLVFYGRMRKVLVKQSYVSVGLFSHTVLLQSSVYHALTPSPNFGFDSSYPMKHVLLNVMACFHRNSDGQANGVRGIEDTLPLPPHRRGFGPCEFVTLWVITGSFNIGGWTTGSSLIALGLNAWRCMITVIIGNVLLGIFCVLSGAHHQCSHLCSVRLYTLRSKTQGSDSRTARHGTSRHNRRSSDRHHLHIVRGPGFPIERRHSTVGSVQSLQRTPGTLPQLPTCLSCCRNW